MDSLTVVEENATQNGYITVWNPFYQTTWKTVLDQETKEIISEWCVGDSVGISAEDKNDVYILTNHHSDFSKINVKFVDDENIKYTNIKYKSYCWGKDKYGFSAVSNVFIYYEDGTGWEVCSRYFSESDMSKGDRVIVSEFYLPGAIEENKYLKGYFLVNLTNGKKIRICKL